MGWPSTYEDILERMSAALDQLRSDVPDDLSIATDTHRQAIDRSLAVLFKIIKEAQSCLELGTDPSLNLAVELNQARGQLDALKLDLATTQKTVMRLQAEMEKAQSDLLAAKQVQKDLRLERNQANAKLEKLIHANPGAAYDLYAKDRGSGR